MKSVYSFIRENWQNLKENNVQLYRERLIKWRRQPSFLRVQRPTRLDRARALGYKAKEGYLVVRARIQRGGKKRPQLKGGRKGRNYYIHRSLGKNYQQIAEERVNKKHPNCEVLGSYFVLKDGMHNWFEVILADRVKVSKYKGMGWLLNGRGRAFRGITSAGRKSRGLRYKGKGREKVRPSYSALSKKSIHVK